MDISLDMQSNANRQYKRHNTVPLLVTLVPIQVGCISSYQQSTLLYNMYHYKDAIDVFLRVSASWQAQFSKVVHYILKFATGM